MPNTYIHHGNAMTAIIAELRAGRTIEAIKQHRTLYGTGLKESKDAVEAIRDALGLNGAAYVAPESVPQFMVFSKMHEHDYDWARYWADDRVDADRWADSRINDNCEDVVVVQVRAQSVVTRKMKAV
jgi:hypothetical protein